jgi:hypothetical protein
MVAQLISRRRLLLLISLFGLIIVATAVLNLPQLFFQSAALWVRILVPLVLLIGLLGGMLSSAWLQVGGWVGIALFLMTSLLMSFPGEDYVLGSALDPAPHPDVNGWLVLVRMIFVTALSILMAVCLRRLRKTD